MRQRYQSSLESINAKLNYETFSWSNIKFIFLIINFNSFGMVRKNASFFRKRPLQYVYLNNSISFSNVGLGSPQSGNLSL